MQNLHADFLVSTILKLPMLSCAVPAAEPVASASLPARAFRGHGRADGGAAAARRAELPQRGLDRRRPRELRDLRGGPR